MTDHQPLIEVRDLQVHYGRGGLLGARQRSKTKAVDGISFSILRGETLGLVGESGCGKSTTGRAILQLHRPSGGDVLFEGQSLPERPRGELRRLRRRMQIVFQDPYASLNPRLTVQRILSEPLEVHSLLPRKARGERVQELLEMVGLNPHFASRYPHEFSGGQRQRIGIARALALEPEFVVCDEPISALDVSIQAQIINLLEDLQDRLGLTYLFIAHDLAVVGHVSDRVAVMYLGKLVELADNATIYTQPEHPYTQALLSAVPIPDPAAEQRRQRVLLEGEVPSSANPPSGCRFRTRCPQAVALCAKVEPAWRELAQGHWAACHRI